MSGSFSFLLLLFAAVSPTDAARCSAETAPETGIGILCERTRVALEARELSVATQLAITVSDLAPSYSGSWVLRAEVAQEGRQLDLARSHYEKAAEVDPNNAAILILMGDFEAAEGNVRGAAVLYEKAAEVDEGFPGLRERLDAVTDTPATGEI